MTKSILYTLIASLNLTVAFYGCSGSTKQLMVNGMICPEGHSEARAKADFTACRYYDLKDADKASTATITVECKECLEKKGYTIVK
ncbi:MAG TPA: hypothetical protein PLM93_09225 [Sulfuricurvum sp.]|nr:MAG: hypothetical protein B7Y30_07460 [Campylobacterales bacterium 16-40-21]OZA02479.1 MAG: hypothetical protein B7X89_09055 [Sulfuricurvum sp. 17-40-25]HQS67348.1 hypothetical protein [Sulfuricurvum sp.]HQT36099.1 hypothetical protein [Sulfuricurvum sp.]